MIPMECPRCSAKLYRGTRFCPTCGLLVEDIVSQDGPDEETTGVLDKTELLAKLSEPGTNEKREAASESEATPTNDLPAEEDLASLEDDETPVDEPPITEKQVSESAEHPLDAADSSEAGDESAHEQSLDEAPSAVESESELERTAAFEPLSVPDGESEPVVETEPVPETPLAQDSDSSAAEDSNEASAYASDSKPSLFERVRTFAAHDRVLTIAVVAAIVLAIGGIVVWNVYNAQVKHAEQERFAAEQRALSTPQVVGVSLSLADFDPTQGSPIPLRVSGETKSGEKIEEVRLLTPDKAELSLLPGSYQVALAGNLATQDGRLYAGSVDTFELVVNDGLSDGESMQEGSTPTFVFVQVAPENISEEDISAVRFWMETAGVENVQTYVDALQQARQTALDAIEQERAAQEEEQLRETEQMTQELEQQLAQQQNQQNQQEQDSTSIDNAHSGHQSA